MVEKQSACSQLQAVTTRQRNRMQANGGGGAVGDYIFFLFLFFFIYIAKAVPCKNKHYFSAEITDLVHCISVTAAMPKMILHAPAKTDCARTPPRPEMPPDPNILR